MPEVPAKIIARMLGIDKKVKVGEYQLSPPLTSLEILEKLVSGKGILRNLLVKEGFNRWDIKSAWGQSPSFDAKSFDSLMSDPELLEKAGVPTEKELLDSSHLNVGTYQHFRSLEGFLFPETYSFQKYDSQKSILLEMLQQFDGRAREILSKHPWSKSKLGFYRLLTLASIVEKESGG